MQRKRRDKNLKVRKNISASLGYALKSPTYLKTKRRFRPSDAVDFKYIDMLQIDIIKFSNF